MLWEFARVRNQWAAVLTMFWIMLAGCGPKPVGVVLTYRVAPQSLAENRPVDMDNLVAAVNERLGSSGIAKKLGGDRLEVGVYGDVNQAKLDAIKRYVGSMGVLEFRIIADSNIAADKSIIEQAKLLPADQKDVMLGDEKVAEWVAHSEAEFGPGDEKRRGLVKRFSDKEPEMLVLMDPMNVTGAYLASATTGLDERDNPTINFSFNREGAIRFGKLTGENVPAPTNSQAHRKLGIILDRVLLSAPEIHARITDRGRISGGAMTYPEMEFIVDILNAGALPAPIEFVEERRVAN